MNAKTKALKEKVISKVGSALSLPIRSYHNARASRFNREASALKTARQYDKAPNFDKNGPTPAFKARVGAEMIKNKYKDGVK